MAQLPPDSGISMMSAGGDGGVRWKMTRLVVVVAAAAEGVGAVAAGVGGGIATRRLWRRIAVARLDTLARGRGARVAGRGVVASAGCIHKTLPEDEADDGAREEPEKEPERTVKPRWTLVPDSLTKFKDVER